MAAHKPRDQVTARVDHEVLEVVERVAEAERRPISNLVRNTLTDWAALRSTTEERAA